MHATHNEYLGMITQTAWCLSAQTASSSHMWLWDTHYPMTDLSEAALTLNSNSILSQQSFITVIITCLLLKGNIFLCMSNISGNIVTFCHPFAFNCLSKLSNSTPVIVFEPFHVIIFRITPFAQENICSFYVFPDNESK